MLPGSSAASDGLLSASPGNRISGAAPDASLPKFPGDRKDKGRLLALF